MAASTHALRVDARALKNEFTHNCHVFHFLKWAPALSSLRTHLNALTRKNLPKKIKNEGTKLSFVFFLSPPFSFTELFSSFSPLL